MCRLTSFDLSRSLHKFWRMYYSTYSCGVSYSSRTCNWCNKQVISANATSNMTSTHQYLQGNLNFFDKIIHEVRGVGVNILMTYF